MKSGLTGLLDRMKMWPGFGGYEEPARAFA